MAAENRKRMRLGAHFHPTGNHVAAWLSPDSQRDAGFNFAHYAQLARTAERGKFDFIFLADALATRKGRLQGLSRWPQYMVFFEPLTLLAAMAVVTERIGLVATASTSYSEPYNLARSFASLDHISGGRAGWNVVTTSSPGASFNFGRDEHYGHDERYRRAREFMTVAKGLWDSWDDDAFVMNLETGIYFDPEKLHPLHHRGEFFAVRGPLNAARPPQGYPVIFQAGGSETGRELAAETAEGVFVQEQSIEKAYAFRQDLRRRAERFGRNPDELKVMAGLSTVVGRTEAEAREKHDFLQSKIHPDVGYEIIAAELAGIDLSDAPLDEPLSPDRLPPTTNFSQT